MKDLEKGIRKQYEYYRTKHPKLGKEAALWAAQSWAENFVLKMNGKLTLSYEKEIHQILDEIQWEDS